MTAVTQIEKLKSQLGIQDEMVGIIDYTKGFPDRFRAIDCFLEKYPAVERRKRMMKMREGDTREQHPQVGCRYNFELAKFEFGG